jgi:signal transduction histidine kinase
MNDSFFSYLHRLELIAFFAGYPLIYAIVLVIAGNQLSKNKLKGKIVSLLPFAYALVGTLYLGFQLKNLYPDYSIEHIKESMYHPYLVLWGISAMFFWIPVMSKKPVISLLHSSVFFFLLLQDIFFQTPVAAMDKHIIRNDMKLYTSSLLLNTGAIIAITLIHFLLLRFKSDKNHPQIN